MSTTTVVIFDQNSTLNQSGLISVVAGQCVQLNAWNLGPGDTVCVDMIRVSDGSIGTGGDSCITSPGIQGQQSLDASPFAPCNIILCMDATRNMIVLRTPGVYRLTLTPAALGTAVVEAMISTDADACAAAGSECCCMPETPWLGSSLSPCLTITPGGPAGHSPIFNINPCCVLQEITNVAVPQLSDEILFISGGACFRATIDSLFSDVVLCDSLQELSPGAFDPAANLVQVALGGCSLVSNTTLLCDMLQALPPCACEPVPGDLVPIIQGGACVLATWPTVDLCDQIGLLAPGVLLATDTVPVRELGGNCKQVPSTAFGAAFPLLAPDGSCAAPSYSFTSSPDSGMFYNGTAVVIGDDNCTDFIEIGASINIRSTLSSINLEAGRTTPGTGASITLFDETSAGIVQVSGASNIGGQVFIFGGSDSVGTGGGGVTVNAGNSSVGVGGTVQINAGSGLLGGGNVVVTGGGTPGSFLVQGFETVLLVDGANQGRILLDTASGTVRIDTSATVRWQWQPGGDVFVAGTPGVAGEVLTSQGAGATPVWAAASASFPLLAPDGTCAAPTYSFTSSPDSGMFYDPAGVGSVIIGDDNCVDSIAIGASISITTGSTLRHRYTGLGEWEVGGTAGVAGQVITSAGPGLPPTWAPVSASVTFPLLAPTSATPQYSFSAQTQMGMAMDGAQLNFGSLEPAGWSLSSALSIDTGVTGDVFLRSSRGDGSRAGNIDIRGGSAINPGVQVDGGGVTVAGGFTNQADGGPVAMVAGDSTGVGVGGNATITAGNAVTGTAGSVLITAGLSSGAAPGGYIRLRTNHENFGSPAAITMDHHGSVQYGDSYVFASQANAAGRSFWYGVPGDAVFTTGQELRIWAGHGRPVGAGGGGGDLDLRGGAATGAVNHGGQLLLKGGDQTGAAIKGYVQLERLTVAPVAAPNVVAGFAPIVMVDDGALRLFGWRQSDGTWRSVTLA